MWGGDGRALIKLVGERGAKQLEQIGVTSPAGLLRHYPRKYLHRGRYSRLLDLAPGEHATVMAEVRHVDHRRARNRPLHIIKVTITDGHTDLPLTFFARRPYMAEFIKKRLQPGTSAMFSGQVKRDKRGNLELIHPDYEPLPEALDEEEAARRAARPVPVYPATAKLPTWKIAEMMRLVLEPLQPDEVADVLPEDVRERRELVGTVAALHMIHDPANDLDWKMARRRFAYEEAFLLQTALARRRADVAAHDATPRPGRPDGLQAALDAQLPFTLTAGQRQVSAEISGDLAESSPMQRLLQGEVGSGKTVVALRAMAQVIDSGGQAALLAPTEVLAQQHARSIEHLLGPLAEAGMLGGDARGTRVVLLTGSVTGAARRQALADAASGAAGIVIGTHALLNEKVQFADLALTVIDEQHRFGVEQRDALRAKGRTMPHQLYLTATPIPRSVAMTFFGDVEVSTLREIPAGRPGVTTHLVPADQERWMQRVWTLIAEQVAAGHRAYVVAPRITSTATEDDGAPELAPEASGDQDSPGAPATVEDTYRRLSQEPALAGIELGLMHGRLSAEEKDEAMAAFADGRAPVLVTTTVIEVGVDVPEASVMVVLDADRFGLSQLHQLRGRIGRGSAAGTCLLVTGAAEDSLALERLTAMTATTDGFVLAEKDLAQRREGDVLGAAQSGRGSSLRLLSVVRDRDLIEDARQDARALITADPNLVHHLEVLTAITELVDPDHEEFLDRA
ncbi:MAG TPA: ATP-dependent DNA helicase RecG [Candidatus Ruania gallistercoris]|uniref:Probable DNA 3'-5' helicase RecG n=1 Tax=Candidatus Ruania gallistercoris TaxID=2838746 RepID=A0A9D2ECJ1_9MICO|nr:ATP-dependent DNA helicase RecG [Candidatus Ruania gallistercoris]